MVQMEVICVRARTWLEGCPMPGSGDDIAAAILGYFRAGHGFGCPITGIGGGRSVAVRMLSC
jgi:hypothetical protein